MKKIAPLLFLLLASFTCAWAQYETPSVEISSGKTGDDIFAKSSGVMESEATKLPGVFGKVRFSKIPKEGYLVECFFLAKSKATGKLYIYNVQMGRKQGPVSEFSFQAPSLAGLRWVAIPAVGRSFETSEDKDENPGDGKFEGWVTRILMSDRVVHIDASSMNLSSLAESNPDIFNLAVDKNPH